MSFTDRTVTILQVIQWINTKQKK